MVRLTILLALGAILISGCTDNQSNIIKSSKDSLAVNINNPDPEEVKPEPDKKTCPSIWSAKRYARRVGKVSFSLICDGKVVGYHKGRHLHSASTGKALLLLSYLRRGQGVAAAKPTLSRMITQSDNQAAHQIYRSLGDGPLKSSLRRAKMKSTKLCGCWADINWSSADYARLFYSFPDSFPKSNRWWAMRQLKSITSYQSWGIPQITRRRGYKTYFKGGWRPDNGGWLVLQGALLIRGKQHLALAVWTSGQPSLESGATKIKRVTKSIFPSRAREAGPIGKTQPSS